MVTVSDKASFLVVQRVGIDVTLIIAELFDDEAIICTPCDFDMEHGHGSVVYVHIAVGVSADDELAVLAMVSCVPY